MQASQNNLVAARLPDSKIIMKHFSSKEPSRKENKFEMTEQNEG